MKQRKDIDKIFFPKIDYDKKYDILYITWFPHFKVDYSLECGDNFVFDIAKNKKKDIKGIEIFDFKKRYMKRGENKKCQK